MESSSSSSTANSCAAVEPDVFVTAGIALLPAFEKRNFFAIDNQARISDSSYFGYISVEKILAEFNEVHHHCQDTERCSEVQGYIYMQLVEGVVCYLLGRAYIGATLKVVIKSPTWLPSICEGLIANPRIDVSLDILVRGAGVHEQGDVLQGIAPFLERSPSARGLHISSEQVNVIVSFGPDIAQAIRTNKLDALSLNTSPATWMEDSSIDPENQRHGDRSESYSKQVVAQALIENKLLTVEADSTFINSFLPQDSTAGNQCVEDLTLLFKRSETVDYPQLQDVTVLITNRTLRKIRLVNANLTGAMWMQIVDSLKTNSILQVLDIGSSVGWLEKPVLEAFLNLLRTHCTQITDMGLAAVQVDSMEDSQKEIVKEALAALNEQLRLNTEYGQVLKNAPRGPPRSARVVFCGPGYAGKTTFCNTMLKRNFLDRQISRFLQRWPGLWRFLYGPDAEKELHKRTRVVDIHLWRDHKDLRITLWDFAGQKEYYALHDYLFPNVNSANLFLVVFSLKASPFDTGGHNGDAFARRLLGIEKELRFWLQFLCSKSKEVIDPKPRVRVVITSIDRVDASTRAQCGFRIDAVLDKLKSRFENRLDQVQHTILLNAHSEELVAAVEAQILKDFSDMVPTLEPTFAVCEDVRRKLGEHMSSTPFITVDHYDKICLEVDGEILRSYATRQAVASYLHNVGEIIYFKNLKIIVINPRWLGAGVLGNLLDVFGRMSETKSTGVMRFFSKCKRDKIYLEIGFLDREGFRTLLMSSLQSVRGSMGIDPDDIIELLSALGICYKDDARGGYLIPSALDDVQEKAVHGLRPLKWRAIAGSRPHIFIGRRLQCANQDRTVFTPGFFPRLQMVLRKYLMEKKFVRDLDSGSGGFEIDRNMLRFMHNARDIIIEYGEGEQYGGTFVDVLVRTSQDHMSTVSCIDDLLNVIRKFWAQPEGNQGVNLVEGIIRPKSVQHLVLCKYRENQSEPISELEEHLKDDVPYQFCWAAVPYYRDRPHKVGFPEQEYALDAIKGQGYHEKTRRNQTGEIQALSGVMEQPKEPLTSFARRAIHEQGWLDTPKFVYILDDKNAFPFLRLHLGCEQKEGPHVLTDQRGRSFVVEDEARQTWMPVLQWTYKLLKLAAVAVGKVVPLAGAMEVGVEMLPYEVSTLPHGPLDQKILAQMGKDREDIIRYYDEMLKESPCCEWLIKFLDLQGNPEKFEHDFRLHKMRYKDTQEIVFLCEACRIQGLQEDLLQPP